MVQMEPIASSMISKVGYDSTSGELFIEFSNGATWRYDEVPQDTFDGLVGGGSAGSFFHDYIKNNFRAVRV